MLPVEIVHLCLPTYWYVSPLECPRTYHRLASALPAALAGTIRLGWYQLRMRLCRGAGGVVGGRGLLLRDARPVAPGRTCPARARV